MVSVVVSVTAVADAQNIDPVAVIVEPDAPVADAQPKLGRMHAVESLYAAGTCIGKTVNRAGDAQGNGAVQFTEIQFGLIRKDDAPGQEGS